MLLAASATATTKVAGSARGAESAAAPFAQSWAKVPQTTAGRKAKSVLVFGVEQDINGFNTALACCNQLIGAFMGPNEALHGAYWHNNFGNPMSHGCVNQPLDVAHFMFGWAPLRTEVWIHT